MKRFPAIGALLLSATLLTACSSGDDAYCDALKTMNDKVGTLSGENAEDPQTAVKEFEKVAKKAPKDLEKDWDQLLEATSLIFDSLGDSGLSEDQIADLLDGKSPEGVSDEELQDIAADLQKSLADFDATATNEASERIATHAQDTCDVDLDSTDGGTAE